MEIRTRPVGSWAMNAYALVCPATKQSVLIDPGADANTLQALLEGTTPIALLITHTHFDHIGALDEMRQRLNVPVMMYGEKTVGGGTTQVDRLLKDQDTIQVGQETLRVYHTPGHTDDMLCFGIAGDHQVIVGDTVFEGGPGKTTSSENFQTTLHTIRTIVLAWDDETICHPGHGPSFRLGDKRAIIESFVQKDHGNFFGDATWDM